ncbi:hypothetical protein [Thermoactinomyces mirandus]|uniref:Uncharacterized protein n=1 Tax=Thermoactinomyces mirandus TaxID=2756294 RepID=A0A7W1XR20_9BACL|nr:hypothetical protein [Thermoactinomyces mirandus]MBA4601560.1 hypothetical protein [Thermoactinomyces mirandus]
MKKNIYKVSRAPSTISPSLSSPTGIYVKSAVSSKQISHDKKSPFLFGNVVISEKNSNFSIPLKVTDQQRYLNSFLKKKMLQLWKKQRFILSMPYPTPEKACEEWRQVYKELKPLVIQSYEEDFSIPLIPFTLFGWLQYVKLVAQITGKNNDAKLWDEITLFFQKCHKNNLLSDLFEAHTSQKNNESF